MREMVYVDWFDLYWFKKYGEKPEKFYAEFSQEAWHNVCRRMVSFLGEPLVCQRIPTLRHYKANEQVPYGKHKDTEFGHPGPLYNLWVPLTEVPAQTLSTTHQWSRRMEPGEALVFEASEDHWVNTLGVERVSFDARFIPERLYRDPGTVSEVNHTKIALGEYYFLSRELTDA